VPPATAAAAAAPILAEVRDLFVVDRTSVLAVRGLSFELRAGQALQLHGPIEAGTPVLRSLVGLARPESGQVRLLGHDPFALGRAETSTQLARVGWLPRAGALLANLTLSENLLLPLLFHRGAADPAVVAAALRRFGLDEAPNLRPEHAPMPVRRRVALARATLLDPEVLLLDHPLDDLDEEDAGAITAALAAWVAEGPRGLIVSSPFHGLATALGARLVHLPVTRA
jgi:ABC-type multidrug transport system ATPase subunit